MKSSKFNQGHDKNKTFSFYEQSNGRDNYWQVTFDHDSISQVFRNGSEIPKDQIDNYSDLIYDNIGEISKSPRMFSGKDFHFNFDHKKLKEDMKKMKANLREMNFDFGDSTFDNKKFQHEMGKMACNLDKLKDIRIRVNFDSDKFEKGMKKLEKRLKNMKFDDMDFNSEKFNKDMEKMQKELGEHKFDINIDLSDLKEKMKDLKIKLKGLDKRLDTLKSFMKDLRKELVKDGYIKNENDNFDMELNYHEMKINGEKLPESLYEKYKEMYKDHFGKDIKEGKDFIIH
jgi:chromosome segregation ATPase